jgi:hypothetical protein
MKLLAGDEMAHADFVDRFLLTRFLRFALGLDFTEYLERLFVLAHQTLFVHGLAGLLLAPRGVLMVSLPAVCEIIGK